MTSPLDRVAHADAIRFIRRIAPGGYFNGTSCWLWTAGKQSAGYGEFQLACKTQYAHRVAWEATHGPIPRGLQIDHLCRVRRCVNPQHMEVVTRRENILRGMSHAAVNSRKIECKHGHPLVPDNVYTPPSGGRYCRECFRLRDKKRTHTRAKR